MLIPHGGSLCGSPTEKQILTESRQNKPEKEGKESEGFFSEKGARNPNILWLRLQLSTLEEWRVRRNGTQSLS